LSFASNIYLQLWPARVCTRGTNKQLEELALSANKADERNKSWKLATIRWTNGSSFPLPSNQRSASYDSKRRTSENSKSSSHPYVRLLQLGNCHQWHLTTAPHHLGTPLLSLPIMGTAGARPETSSEELHTAAAMETISDWGLSEFRLSLPIDMSWI
jgi:hypothetical protein